MSLWSAGEQCWLLSLANHEAAAPVATAVQAQQRRATMKMRKRFWELGGSRIGNAMGVENDKEEARLWLWPWQEAHSRDSAALASHTGGTSRGVAGWSGHGGRCLG